MRRPIKPAIPLSIALASFGALAGGAEPLLPKSKAPETDESWRHPVAPFPLAERSWYIGTEGLSAILVKTPDGAVLIDGGLPQAADLLLARMRALGVAPGELKWILHSHAHNDHVGPLAAIRRATGARVVSNAESAALLTRGGAGDLHYGDDDLYPPVPVDRLVQDGEAVELGGMRFVAHFTPGHTPGSLSWTWNDMRDGQPLRIAYVDSLGANESYRLADNPRYPRIADDFRRSFAVVRALPCDLLLTPHPAASGWAPANTAAPHPQPVPCRAHADEYERGFESRLSAQSAPKR